MASNRNTSAAFTLLELLIVIVLVSTLAVLIVPNAQSAVEEQLRAAARIVAGDLDYARMLSLTYNSEYSVDFESEQNRLVVRHSGSDTTLNALPPSAFRSSQDAADEHVVRLGSLPGIDERITIFSSYYIDDSLQQADSVEFRSLGETTRSQSTYLWLAAGSGAGRVYIPLTIHPVTGLARVGPLQNSTPPAPLVGQGASQLETGGSL